ncbi:MAG: patatin-like phospholipase family protein [Eubacteriales bacterium]
MMEYGLVLSGGGAKGSFEIGVWKALRELNINITAVAGTSVGALNGAIIAQNEIEWAIDFWTNLTMDQVFSFNQKMTDKYITDWSKKDLQSFVTSFKDYIFDGGLDITPLKNTLKKCVDEEKIRNSPIRLGLVTISLSDLKPLELMIEDIPQGKLVDYLLASAAFPAFKRYEIDGSTFIDGGIYDNLPINLLASQGYKNLITVELPAPGLKSKIKFKDLHITHIKNSEHLGLFLDFNPAVMKKNIQMGYLDTLKKFNALQGVHYYFSLNKETSLYVKFKNTLGSFLKNELGMKLPLLLGIEEVMSKSEIVKEITRLVTLTPYKGQDTALSLLEITANYLEIPRMEIYSPNRLIKEIIIMVNKVLSENIQIIKSHNSIKDIFTASNELSINPLTNIRLIGYYIYFLSLNSNSSPLNKLISRFSPETILSIITLIYLMN